MKKRIVSFTGGFFAALALSLCLTTMCPSFLNDSYFHVVTNFSGMDINTSLKTWTMGSILVPAFGSVIFIILSMFIH